MTFKNRFSYHLNIPAGRFDGITVLSLIPTEGLKLLAKSENTVLNILAAAEALFLEKNYADVTMGQIALASNVTKGGLYHHFSSKEELYLRLLYSDLAEKAELFGKAIDASGTSMQRLRHLTEEFLNLPKSKRELIRLVRRDINIFSAEQRKELIRAYQSSLPNLVESVIKDGIRDKEIEAADARLLSWHYVALVEVTLSNYADKVFEDTESKLDFVLNLFFSGAARKGNN